MIISTRHSVKVRVCNPEPHFTLNSSGMKQTRANEVKYVSGYLLDSNLLISSSGPKQVPGVHPMVSNSRFQTATISSGEFRVCIAVS